jgi:hypothetical protein
MLADWVPPARIVRPEAAREALVDDYHGRRAPSVVTRDKFTPPPQWNPERVEIARGDALDLSDWLLIAVVGSDITTVASRTPATVSTRCTNHNVIRPLLNQKRTNCPGRAKFRPSKLTQKRASVSAVNLVGEQALVPNLVPGNGGGPRIAHCLIDYDGGLLAGLIMWGRYPVYRGISEGYRARWSIKSVSKNFQSICGDESKNIEEVQCAPYSCFWP